MTLTEPAAVPVTDKKAQPKPAPVPKAPADKSKADVVTLDALAQEMKVSSRDARMLLRLAAKQKSKFPNLGREHVARQPWQWTPGSKALEEARKALASS